MLRPEMKPVDGTPGVGTPSKPKPKPEELKPSYVPGGGRPGHPQPTPQPEPAAGPPAFDAGPSPNYTQEVTSYAQPPTSEAEAQRREQRKDRAKKRWEKARKQASAAPTPPETVEVADFDDLGWLDSEPLPLSDSPDWPGGVPLSQGQSLHVDHLLSIEDDTMVREMLIGIKRDGIPPRAFESDYLSQFAEWGWDDLSSARTLQVLESVRNSYWDDLLAQADRELIETTAQDLADNTIEGLIVLDAKTGETLLNRTGVLGAGGSQYVGLQDYEVEAFEGLELIFVHNHPNGSDASEADLRAAFAAGAEMLMVVTPQGYEYVYIRGANGMVRMRAEEASYKVGPGTAAEHVLLEAKSWEQARRNQLNPPEFVFHQSDPEVVANMDVNPHEIARCEELKDFVNTGIDELQEFGEKELLAKIGESIELVQDIFGYTVRFHDKYDVRANVELAMAQVYKLGTILFHFLNDLGKEIMESTPGETIYILGADERIAKVPEAEYPKHQGLVVLPESTTEGNPDLKIVYLGSEIEAGTIGREVAHEIDRRMGDYGTVKVQYHEGSSLPISELGPVGSFLWFLKNAVVNQWVNLPKGDPNQGYYLGLAATYLDENARANMSNAEREVFADLVAAKVLGPLEKDFFSTAFADAEPIRFLNQYGSADIAIALEQYFDQDAEYRSDTNAKPPEQFSYTKYHDLQRYDEFEWPVMPIEGDEE